MREVARARRSGSVPARRTLHAARAGADRYAVSAVRASAVSGSSPAARTTRASSPAAPRTTMRHAPAEVVARARAIDAVCQLARRRPAGRGAAVHPRKSAGRQCHPGRSERKLRRGRTQRCSMSRFRAALWRDLKDKKLLAPAGARRLIRTEARKRSMREVDATAVSDLLAAMRRCRELHRAAEAADSPATSPHGRVDGLPRAVCRRGRRAAPRQRQAALGSRSTAPISALRTSTATQLQILFGDSLGDRELRTDRSLHGLALRRRIRNDRSSRMGPTRRASPRRSIPPIRLGQNPGHDGDVGDRSRARDGSRQDADGRLQQRDARIRRLQHHEAAGLHEDARVQRRPDLRHDTRLLRRRVLEQENAHLGCRDGTPGCTSDTMLDAADKRRPGSGFCTDPTSPLRGDRCRTC